MSVFVSLLRVSGPQNKGCVNPNGLEFKDGNDKDLGLRAMGLSISPTYK